MILTDTAKTKETALQKKLIEKRNLFGLGVTSLIAACSADGAGGGGDGNRQREEVGPDPLPFKADKAKKLLEPENLAEAKALTADQANDYSADKSNAGGLTVTVKQGTDIKATLLFSEAINTNDLQPNSVNIHKLTTTSGQYDLVISAPTIDKNSGSDNLEYHKGRIFIYWDVAKVTAKDSPHLEIKGNTRDDRIGINPPEFLQIGGTDNNYDMVIRSQWVDFAGAGTLGNNTNEGAIYILWDVAGYETTTTITLDGSDTNIKDSGLLTIKGAGGDKIGTHAPDFLQIDGDNKLDMVIRSNAAGGGKGAIYILWDVDNYSGDKTAAITLSSGTGVGDSGLLTIKGTGEADSIGTNPPEFLKIGGKDDNYDMVIRAQGVVYRSAEANAGAMYILWDVDNYSGSNTPIILNDGGTGVGDSGLLIIKGSRRQDNIGTSAPDFLQIGGVAGEEKYDMVIRSHLVSKSDGSPGQYEGAIYILWDVDNYSGRNINGKTAVITLSSAAGVDDSGLLTIYGAITRDYIGTSAPEFLQLGKENDKYDMVIRSEGVDKSGSGGTTNEGAIYVLWDVDNYYGENKTINLATASASSSLLTIYGATAGSGLGSSDILYKANNEDSDVDGDTTNDLVFKDKDYTYVLFGDKIATTTGIGEDAKVASKTIDLAVVQAAFTDENATSAGFFNYNFGTTATDISDGDMATIPADNADATGYRFAKGTGGDGNGGYTFADVQDNFPKPIVSLSDADADLGVWDIA